MSSMQQTAGAVESATYADLCARALELVRTALREQTVYMLGFAEPVLAMNKQIDVSREFYAELLLLFGGSHGVRFGRFGPIVPNDVLTGYEIWVRYE